VSDAFSTFDNDYRDYLRLRTPAAGLEGVALAGSRESTPLPDGTCSCTCPCSCSCTCPCGCTSCMTCGIGELDTAGA
jgi:hypothetical protein